MEGEFFPQAPHIIRTAHVPQISAQELPTSSFMVLRSLKAVWAVKATPYIRGIQYCSGFVIHTLWASQLGAHPLPW